MIAVSVLARWPVQLTAGFATGAAVATVDNLLFEGEISPIVIVALLLAATVTAGAVWGRCGWVAAVATWVWVPAPHLTKRVLGLPDTLHPNTYASILMLAAFSLAVSVVGTACGLLARQLIINSSKAA
jgi:hypothetical protein